MSHNLMYPRIGCIGQSGSGKSTIADRIAWHFPRVILFDVVESRTDAAKEQGYTKIESFNDLRRYVVDHYSKGFRVWFCPDVDDDDLPLMLSDLSFFILDLQSQYIKAFGKPDLPEIMLYVDELADSFPNYGLKKDQQGFAKMCRKGRHNNVTLVGASQRFAEVSTKFRGQLTTRFLFKMTDPADLKMIEELGGAEHGKMLAQEVRKLPPLHYIRMENATFKRGVLTFPYRG